MQKKKASRRTSLLEMCRLLCLERRVKAPQKIAHQAEQRREKRLEHLHRTTPKACASGQVTAGMEPNEAPA